MVEKVAIDLHGTTKVQVGEHSIDFKKPWQRYSMYEAIEHFTGKDISTMNESEMRITAESLGIKTDDTMGRGRLIDEIFGETCEHKLIQPTFITDYPVEMSPLAKKHRTLPGLVERFEAICNGKEICNAFSELNDPIDQRKRFEEQLELGRRGDEEAMQLDDDFLRAIEYGMPPTAGLGIGIDRLTMIMTNSSSIQDVLFFPQMRPESNQGSLPAEEEITDIPEPWNEVLSKMGIRTKEQLKEINPNKLFNDLGGMRKKLKIQDPMPALEVIRQWCNQGIKN
jgi:lysyl-tRNA synthetase class 2